MGDEFLLYHATLEAIVQEVRTFGAGATTDIHVTRRLCSNSRDSGWSSNVLNWDQEFGAYAHPWDAAGQGGSSPRRVDYSLLWERKRGLVRLQYGPVRPSCDGLYVAEFCRSHAEVDRYGHVTHPAESVLVLCDTRQSIYEVSSHANCVLEIARLLGESRRACQLRADTPWPIVADWLEEHNETWRAEALRRLLPRLRVRGVLGAF